MKVLHINSNYIYSFLHQTMVEHLDALGVESKVFVPTYDKSKAVVPCRNNVTVIECFKRWDRITYFRKQRKIIGSLFEISNDSEINLIHAYTLFTDGNAAMRLSEKIGVPYVVAVRDTDVNTFFKKAIHLRHHGLKILRSAKAIFFLSLAYRDIVINKYVPVKYRDQIMSKSFVIPNGIDDFWLINTHTKNGAEIQKRFKTEKLLKCIFVGEINKRKNVELTLKSLDELVEQGWQCELVAVGKIRDSEIFSKLRKYSNFHYVEPQKKENLLDYYRDADIFIMPSHTETFGLVYAEALSQGLPVLYTKGQGFDGQFEDGLVGYAIDDRDKHDIAEKIMILVENYVSIAERCSAASNKFDWNRICEQYLRIYNTIIGTKQTHKKIDDVEQ